MTIKPDLTVPIPDRLDTVHFVGIGGAGMSGIARMFVERGATVSGSDRGENAQTAALAGLGVTISIGHDAANVPASVDAVVVTSALWPDNPELAEAHRRGVPVLHRSKALKALIGRDRLVAVAGAHGKTTSTGMIVTGLVGLAADPSFVNGGIIQPVPDPDPARRTASGSKVGVGSRLGTDGTFVVEADESDGSFLLYDTAVALITNVDPDHLDHYGSREAFDAAFVRFADAATEVAVVSADDPGAIAVTAAITKTPVVTFGESAAADFRVTEIVTDGPVAFRLTASGATATAQLRIPGRHNAVNAAGAVAVLVSLGHPMAAALDAVAAFAGTERRFELHGVVDGVSVFDDYAHHPTEVAAALSAARTVVGAGRIIAVHQPHLYSRTSMFAGEFAQVLEREADHTVVLDVYGAREDPVPGVTGAIVADRFADRAAVDYVPDWQAAADRVAEVALPGDFVITLGCGNVNRLVPQLLASLGARPAQAREQAAVPAR